MRGAAIVVLLAGCDVIFKLQPPPEAGVDPPDASPDALVTCGGTSLERQDFTSLAMLAQGFSPMSGANGSSIDVRNGQFVATPGIATGYAEIESNTAHDFAGLIVQVRVERATDQPYTETFFDVHTPTNDRQYFSIGFGKLDMALKYANGNVTQKKSIDYVPNVHVYLRIEQIGSEVVFLTSVDGSEWSERHRTTTLGFNLAQVSVRMGAGAYAPGSDVPSTAVFDEYELCKP